MTWLSSASPGTSVASPIPIPDEISRPFFDGARERELRLQRCGGCGMWQFGFRYCEHCGGTDLQWTRASGRGTIYSFAVVHQSYHTAFAHRIPYNIAIVETEEGPRLPANIIDAEPDQLRVGLPVSVVFEQLCDTVWVPRFCCDLPQPSREDVVKP